MFVENNAQLVIDFTEVEMAVVNQHLPAPHHEEHPCLLPETFKRQRHSHLYPIARLLHLNTFDFRQQTHPQLFLYYLMQMESRIQLRSQLDIRIFFVKQAAQ